MADTTLEEALAAATVDEELVTPVNEVLIINPETRTINVPDSEKLFGARQDMGVERKYFKCPRIVGDNIDLSQHRIFVNYVPSKQDGTYNLEDDVQGYWCKDLAVDGDFITFSWEISGNVTRSAGYIAFAVYAKTIDENGNLKTKWHTTIAIGNVLETLPDGEEWIAVYPDIVMQLLERMDALEQGGGSGETPNAVQYVDQTLTQEQQTQARTNIGAASTTEVSKLSKEIEEIKETLPHTNILNVENSEVGFAYKYTIGSDMVKAVNDKYTACNQIFSVKEGEKYTINWLYGAIYLYDIDKKLVSYNYADTVPYTLEVAQNGYMTVAGSTVRKNNIMLVKGDTLPSEYVEYSVFDIITEQGNRLENKVSNLDSLNGVKWCAFGDSLTTSSTLANMNDKKNYVDYVSNSLGLNVTNCGFGGTGYMKTENRFVNRVSTIPTDTEILTVFGSFNDYEYIESSLGVFGDSDTNTIYGCMKSFFESVFSRCPDIVIGVILPTKWGYLSPQKDSSASAKCDLYIKALIETAEYFNLPILDLYNHSNLRAWDDSFAQRYYKDDDLNGVANTVHPLDEAHKKFIAPKVEAFIKSIYRVY